MKFLNLEHAAIKDLNPGLVPAVFESRMRLPKGYQLRIPYLAETTAESAANAFLGRIRDHSKNYKSSVPALRSRRVGSLPK